MDILAVRQELRRKSIYDIPLRVTFYARVSTDSDEQINSLENQIRYYTTYISKNPNWTYVEGYIDEGLSAATTKKREQFHKMIEDATDGLFDIIITKEITRFARNTLDSIQYTRELLRNGVAVFFQNDNINTLDEDSELRLTIMSGIAQDELRKLSSRVKFGHQQAIKNGVVLGNSRIFGYKKDNGRLVIDEDEAPMVKELFDLYSTGQYSMKQLEKIFWKKGYKNHNGNPIAHSTMSAMISNPKYKGFYAGNKVKVIDLFTKKQKFLSKDEWIMYKDETGNIVPAIVDEKTWEKANDILEKRSNDVKGRQGICNHANLLTGKLYCTACGMPFYRRDSVDKYGNKNSKWVCSGKIKNGAHSCKSFAIYEEELKPILFDIFNEARVSSSELIEQYINMYNSVDFETDISSKVEELNRRIDLVERKRNKMLEYNVLGQISDKEFISVCKACDSEKKELEEKIFELEEQQTSYGDFRKHIDIIKKTLLDAENDAETGLIDKEFINHYIDKIYVTPDDGRLRLEIKIFTGSATNKYLEKLNSRMGHTSKKIRPIRIVKYERKDRNEQGHIRLIEYLISIKV